MTTKKELRFNVQREGAAVAAYATQKNYTKAANVFIAVNSLFHRRTRVWKITDAVKRVLNTHNAHVHACHLTNNDKVSSTRIARVTPCYAQLKNRKLNYDR
jgi:hypothetical protein